MATIWYLSMWQLILTFFHIPLLQCRTQNSVRVQNMSYSAVWFISIDPDCVKQAEHRWEVFLLFASGVWARPQQWGASSPLHLFFSRFSHPHSLSFTQTVFVTLQSASLTTTLSLSVSLSQFLIFFSLPPLPLSHYRSISLTSILFLLLSFVTVFFNFLRMNDSSRDFNNK